jgi:aminoglycoside phosphotransferase (APT) family kinase protein
VADWDAEVVIDEALVRALLGDQFPKLDASSARLLGEGWDNAVWMVEERWAFRFPRRAIALPGVEREIGLLPRLAPLLPVRIPVPTFAGKPSERFPWPFFGAPLLRGVEPAEAELRDTDRERLGADLGRFLRALHDVELEVELPYDLNRRADMGFRVALTRERIEEASALWTAPPWVEDLLAEAEELPPSEHASLVHGDLHIRHVLLDGGALAGVIDWGDVCRADPAIDLLAVWTLLGPDGRERFAAEYGTVEEAQLVRSRVLALYLGLMLLLYARDVGFSALERECLAGLERTLVDWR